MDRAIGSRLPAGHRRRDLRREAEARPCAIAAAPGGLWNTFTMASRPEVLMSVFERLASWLLRPLIELAQASSSLDPKALGRFYASVPGCDLSRRIFERCPDLLAVLPMAPCGLTDLGTPERVRHVQAGLGTDDIPCPRWHDDRGWDAAVNRGNAN